MNLTALYLVASTLAFAAYGADKLAAVQGWRRIPENFLHLLGVLCGWPGALAAQRLFRHKTRKTRFQLVFWGTAVMNCVTVGAFFRI